MRGGKTPKRIICSSRTQALFVRRKKAVSTGTQNKAKQVSSSRGGARARVRKTCFPVSASWTIRLLKQGRFRTEGQPIRRKGPKKNSTGRSTARVPPPPPPHVLKNREKGGGSKTKQRKSKRASHEKKLHSSSWTISCTKRKGGRF